MNSLLKTLEDPIEKHREMTISLFEKLLEEIKFEIIEKNNYLI